MFSSLPSGTAEAVYFTLALITMYIVYVAFFARDVDQDLKARVITWWTTVGLRIVMLVASIGIALNVMQFSAETPHRVLVAVVMTTFVAVFAFGLWRAESRVPALVRSKRLPRS